MKIHRFLPPPVDPRTAGAVALVLCLALTACSGLFTIPPQSTIVSAAPTIVYTAPTAHPLFRKPGQLPGQAIHFPANQQATPTNQVEATPIYLPPSPTSFPTATWLPTTATRPNARTLPIYKDQLRHGWEIISFEDDMTFDPKSIDEAYQSRVSLAAAPLRSHAKIYIVSGSKNSEVYLRDEVYGVSLRIYSGERGLDLYDLALTMIGSDVYTYWRLDDDSVISKTPYEETFLRYFGFNENIPPFTWAEITIWLDEMRFDPDYKYVTGLYITNRKGFTRTFYVDDVELILKPDADPVRAATLAATANPVTTAAPATTAVPASTEVPTPSP